MPKPLPRPLAITLTAVGIFLALGILALGGTALAFRGKIYPNVYVDGMSASTLSRGELTARLEARVDRRMKTPITVAVENLQATPDENGRQPVADVTVLAADLGVQYDVDAAIDAAWSVGHESRVDRWLTSVLRTLFVRTNIELTPTVDAEEVDGFVATAVMPLVTAPEAAKLRVDGSNVVIDEAAPGLAIDASLLEDRLVSALKAGVDGEPFTLRAPVSRVEPDVTRAQLEPLAGQWNRLGDMRLSLHADDRTIAPRRTDILSWYHLVQGEDGTLALQLNESALEAYLKRVVGARLNADPSMKEVLAVLEPATTQAGESEAALPARTASLTLRPANTEVPAGSYTLGRFEGKYVEINLREQKLYRINGGTLEKVYRVSTGKWSTPTPRGTFTISYKHPRAYSAAFGLYMPYWMNFQGTSTSGDVLRPGAYGLHELPEWPNGYKEGQSHLGTPVSHGCVRLGIGDASELYAWAHIDMPVVIY